MSPQNLVLFCLGGPTSQPSGAEMLGSLLACHCSIVISEVLEHLGTPSCRQKVKKRGPMSRVVTVLGLTQTLDAQAPRRCAMPAA